MCSTVSSQGVDVSAMRKFKTTFQSEMLARWKRGFLILSTSKTDLPVHICSNYQLCIDHSTCKQLEVICNSTIKMLKTHRYHCHSHQRSFQLDHRNIKNYHHHPLFWFQLLSALLFPGWSKLNPRHSLPDHKSPRSAFRPLSTIAPLYSFSDSKAWMFTHCSSNRF